MFSTSSVVASEKGALCGIQTRRSSFALCKVVNYCKYLTPNRHVIVISMKKRTMSLLKQSYNSRANGAMIRKIERQIVQSELYNCKETVMC